MQNEPVVHIVDDDDAVRDALQMLMTSENIAAKTYASAEDFITQKNIKKPGCLLLDVRMPGMNGLQLLEQLKKNDISLPVILITGHGDISMAVQAMKDGAADFIEKPFNNERLLNTIKVCLDDCINLNSKTEQRKEMQQKIATLTRREREIMNLLVEGKKNKLIAQELGISSRTVELHRAKVMEKLHANSLSDIVRTALLVV